MENLPRDGTRKFNLLLQSKYRVGCIWHSQVHLARKFITLSESRASRGAETMTQRNNNNNNPLDSKDTQAQVTFDSVSDCLLFVQIGFELWKLEKNQYY